MNSSEIRATLTLGMIFALRMLGLFMIIPVFSIYGQSYSSSTPFLIGLAVGIYGLAQAVLQIPVSMLAEKYSRKTIIITGLVMFSVGGAMSAMATDIWLVILGRFLAGAGAISAVIMALVADLTREQNRSKAMAFMGMLIGGSIFTAFIIGPILVGYVGISGLFWLTSISGVLGIGLVLILPTPTRSQFFLQYDDTNSTIGTPSKTNFITTGKSMISTALGVQNLKFLYLAVFALHLLMTTIFVLLPVSLQKMGYGVDSHGMIYLPLLLVGFVLAIPMIIVAEVKQKMRQVFIFAMSTIVIGLAVAAVMYQSFSGVLIGLGIFFIGFNLLEAMIPSWLSKQAPISVKNTVMGVSSSSQFFGSFLGGTLGGILLTQSADVSWYTCAAFALIVFVIVLKISSPPYLTSITLTLPKFYDYNTDLQSCEHLSNENQSKEHRSKQSDMYAQWQQALFSLDGVEDVVTIAQDNICYVKIDKKQIDQKQIEEFTENFVKNTRQVL